MVTNFREYTINFHKFFLIICELATLLIVAVSEFIIFSLRHLLQECLAYIFEWVCFFQLTAVCCFLQVFFKEDFYTWYFKACILQVSRFLCMLFMYFFHLNCVWQKLVIHFVADGFIVSWLWWDMSFVIIDGAVVVNSGKVISVWNQFLQKYIICSVDTYMVVLKFWQLRKNYINWKWRHTKCNICCLEISSRCLYPFPLM